MSLKVPFIMNGGNKKKINILNNEKLDLNFKLKNLNLLSLVNKIVETNNIQEDLVKASDTKEYYMNLNNSKNKKVKKSKKSKKI